MTAPELAFGLVAPPLAVPDYRVEIRPGDRAALELDDERQALVYLILNRGGGWQAFGEKNKPIQQATGKTDGPAHHRNFLECVRAGGEKRPNADIEIGHHSAALSHLGNIATRLARTLRFDPRSERIEGDEEANALVRRRYREGHWAVPKGV